MSVPIRRIPACFPEGELILDPSIAVEFPSGRRVTVPTLSVATLPDLLRVLQRYVHCAEEGTPVLLGDVQLTGTSAGGCAASELTEASYSDALVGLTVVHVQFVRPDLKEIERLPDEATEVLLLCEVRGRVRDRVRV